jgi:hypothetical protein
MAGELVVSMTLRLFAGNLYQPCSQLSSSQRDSTKHNTLLPTNSTTRHRLRLRLRSRHPLKQSQIQGNPFTHPRRPLRMIPLLLGLFSGDGIDRIRMDKNAQRTPIYDEPGYESTELGGREEVYFEHGHGVGTDRGFPEFVDAEFGDCV